MKALIFATVLSLLASAARATPEVAGGDWPRVTPDSVGLDPAVLDAG
jgi:hypothetical protein